MQILEFSKMNDAQLSETLEKYNIGLTNDEARKITKILDRDPSLVEAVIWGIQGSEHASYKSTRSHLKGLPTSGPNVILGPSEDSGIIKLCDLPNGDKYGIVLSHESHNSPSQIVPYEGAATGVGGIMRDIVCMGSKAIGVLDSMRFGELSNEKSKLIAKGCIKGVAGYGNPIGVPNLGGDIYFDENFKDYCLVNVFACGLIKESQLIHSFAPDEAGKENYDFIIIGKPTDESGFGGSSFSSKLIDEEKEEQNKGAVQEPNPFLERHLMASTYDLFKELEAEGNLDKVGFKDMGAGGILCATVELVSPKNFGAEIDIEKIHTAYDGINPEVIACSETQERFAWVCHPSLTQKILDHYNKKWALGEVSKGAGASHVGHATEDPFFKLSYKGDLVCNAKSVDITEGLLYDRKWKIREDKFEEPDFSTSPLAPLLQGEGCQETPSPSGRGLGGGLLKNLFLEVIGSPNCASQSSVYENYDKSVQGNTVVERSEAKASVIKPLTDEDFSEIEKEVGNDCIVPESEKNRNESIVPKNEKNRNESIRSLQEIRNIGVAYSQTGNGRYGLISSYEQATNAVASAMLQVACTGAVPQTITDCLNYGNPEKEIQMGDLVEGIRGIKDACNGIKLKGENCATPIISGNVSMYKEVPTSAIIGCMGKISNAEKSVTKKLKSGNSSLILLGKRKDELGASEFYRLLTPSTSGRGLGGGSCDKHGRLLGANVPKTNFNEVEKIIYRLTDLAEEEKILAANEIETGGLARAVVEMLMPNQKDGSFEIGASLNFSNSELKTYQNLFSETLGVIIEVSKENEKEVLEKFGETAEKIGETNNIGSLKFKAGSGEGFKISNQELLEKWGKGLREKLI